MDRELLKYLVMGGIAGLIGYWAYLRTDVFSAMIVFVFVAYMLYSLRDPENIWDSMSVFLNPFLFAIMSFFIGYLLYSLSSQDVYSSFVVGLGSMLLGGVFSTLVYKYWNIGG